MNTISRCLCACAVALAASAMAAQDVTYKPFKHYTDRVAQFAKMPPVDSCDIVMLGNSLTCSIRRLLSIAALPVMMQQAYTIG